MTGPEFFMKYAGYKLLASDRRTGDPFCDADALFRSMIIVHQGSKMRFSSCWFVVTQEWAATSLKIDPSLGFLLGLKELPTVAKALRQGPCVWISLGKRTLDSRDVYLSHDPRAVYRCDSGARDLFDFTADARTAKHWLAAQSA